MRPLFDGWAILTFAFWMGFCWLLCVRRMFWGDVKKNVITSVLFALSGIALVFLATRPWVNTVSVHIPYGGNFPPPKYNSEILNLLGAMCLTLSLAIRIVLQPVPTPNPRVLVSDENISRLRGTNHIIDDTKLKTGDIVILTAQNRATENGPWLVRKHPWRRPLSHPKRTRSFGSWFIANSGYKYSNTLWIGSLCRNDIIGEGDLEWKQISQDSRIRTFVSLDIPCSIGESAKFLLRVGVLPYQIRHTTREEVVDDLRLHGYISPTSVGILLHKPDPNQNSAEWGPRVRAVMRLLIHSGEFEYAKDPFESAIANGFEHRMTETEVRANFKDRVRNETPDPKTPTRFEREEVI
jgi:hypothetical protein